ncbi:alpha/beta fold hydrolase [Microbacterium album]|uniref:3-oxoadipate enol-lactonase n=1 Tax=Microbacterium album TaxID=2053191 RepID=A0A917IHS0_9MICO|nr:alpha/beta hydrolase [Microbacterium album]GGH48406.1 3-oxoadipate enol-lactonase [Microbacterium album]
MTAHRSAGHADRAEAELPPPRRIALPGATVACWDAGGEGDPVVFLHAAWGSGEHWAPQLTSFRRAGLRPIAWSRRGHYGSDVGPAQPPPTADDLDALADTLGLERFHLVGTAYGAFEATDYAIARGERLLSLTLACSLCGIADPDFVAETARLVNDAWHQLPIELRELSASYRFTDPAGTEQWRRLTARALTQRVEQPALSRITRAAIAGIAAPTLFLTGSEDPYMPPPRMRALSEVRVASRFEVIPEAGHSASWENPEAFDRAVLAHIAATPQPGGRALG